MKKLTLLILLIFFKGMNAQTSVTIPDANFAVYLQSIIPTAMNGNQMDTTNTAVTTATHKINVPINGISNLFGIQYFSSLDTLLFINGGPFPNSISSIPSLPNSLRYLSCGGNSLTSLSSLPNSLKFINCSNNKLIALPTLPNSLDTLICGNNLLSVLPALPSSLIYLDCRYQQNSSFTFVLTSLPSLPNSLKTLFCQYNGITNLPVLPSSLITLRCENNSLTAIPSLPNSLTWLSCGTNQLTNLPTLNNSLQFLGCDNNSLTNLPALPNSLIELTCGYNLLTNLPVLDSALTKLVCPNNSLTALPNLPDSLYALYCQNNNITCFPTFPIYINLFYIDPNPYNCLPNYIYMMSAVDMAKPLCGVGNTNGCAVVTGIKGVLNLNSEINIYPNPAQNNFTVETNSIDKQVLKIFDVNGKLVLTQALYGKAIIDSNNLSEGVYNLSMINSNKATNKKLIIVR